jgi:hypothetical protein
VVKDIVLNSEFDEKIERRSKWKKKKKHNEYCDDFKFKLKKPYKRNKKIYDECE